MMEQHISYTYRHYTGELSPQPGIMVHFIYYMSKDSYNNTVQSYTMHIYRYI